MRFAKRCLTAAALLACVLVAPPVSALAINQVDTFEDGTTQGWTVAILGAPHPAPPRNIPTGGPGGADDNYLLVTALGGGGAGSRLTVLNTSQWAGNFIDAGIGAIRMDVINLGATDLNLRLLFEDPMGGPPVDVAFSAASIPVPAGAGWMTIVFPIAPVFLDAASGGVTEALMHTTVMRLYHSTADGFPGEAIATLLGVDNIRAVPDDIGAAPEPSALALVAVCLVALWLARRPATSRSQRTQ